MDAARRAADPTCKAGSYDRVVQIRNGKAAWTDVVEFDPKKLTDPFRWDRPRRVFVASMSDPFHEDLPDDMIDQMFAVMIVANRHTYQVLTKRPERMRRYTTTPGRHEAWSKYIRRLAPGSYFSGVTEDWWPCHAGHIWLGVSVENRKHGVPRIDELRRTPAALRFLSCEPLLEDLGTLDLTEIGWVIDGCESGRDARPAKREWFASIEDQCRAAGVPYFHKQEVVDGALEHDFPDLQEFPK
jgi:protein gp37